MEAFEEVNNKNVHLLKTDLLLTNAEVLPEYSVPQLDFLIRIFRQRSWKRKIWKSRRHPWSLSDTLGLARPGLSFSVFFLFQSLFRLDLFKICL